MREENLKNRLCECCRKRKESDVFSNIFISEKSIHLLLIDFCDDDDRDRYYQYYILVLDKILLRETHAEEKEKEVLNSCLI